MKLLVTLVFAVCMITGSLGAKIVPGPCRSVNVINNFDVPAYMGTWYELQRYDFDRETGLDCGTGDYSLLDGGAVIIINSATDISTEERLADTAFGLVAYPDETPLRGLLNVTFPEGSASTHVNYHILSTDYTTHSVVWSCTDLPDGNSREYAWVLARSYPADESVQNDIDIVINENLDESELRTTVQDQLLCLGGGITPY